MSAFGWAPDVTSNLPYSVFHQGRIFRENVTEIFQMAHPNVSSADICRVHNFGTTCKISDSCHCHRCETWCFLEFPMTTFTIMVITAFFIGLAIACSLVPHSGSKIITSTALIKGTCDFIQPIKLCLSLNFLYAKMLNRKAKQSRMGEPFRKEK